MASLRLLTSELATSQRLDSEAVLEKLGTRAGQFRVLEFPQVAFRQEFEI